MVNSRDSLSKIPPMNNDAKPYIITLDIYKEGYWAYDISNYYKGRVDDNGTPFQVRWFEHGQIKNVQGLRPFIRGTVGQHTVDDETDPDNPKVVPSPDCSQIDQTGETTDTMSGGIAVYRMVNQCFTQEGMFYGEIGLKDSSGLVLSSVDIAFKVLGGRMNMVGARKFYVSEFEKALDNLNAIIEKTKKDFSQQLSQVITDARNTYNAQVKNSQDALVALNAQVQANRDEQANLSQRLAGTEQQIEVNDVLKTSTFNARMDQEKTARTNGNNDILQKFSNLLTSTSGKETDSAPEIKDARLGSSLVRGLSYDTLGNGIRDQFNKLFKLLVLNESSQTQRISKMDYDSLVARFNLLSSLLYDSSQLYEEPLLDIDEVQIETENGDLISAETRKLKTDTTLSQLNVSADAYSVGQALKKLQTQSLGAPTGGDMLLSEVPPKPFGFDADKGTDVGLVLKPTGDNGFDSKMVESPSIIWDDAKNKYIMVFTAYDSNNVGSIGYAFSTDLKNWENQGQLFKNSGNAANGDKNGCTGPCLVKYDGIYYLFYLGLNGEGYEGWPINLCLATSTDLATWTYKGVVIAPSKDIPWISNTIYHPDIMKIGSYWYIFFNANGTIDGQAAERTGFAFSTKIDGPYTVDPDRISKFAEDAGDHSGIQCGDPSVFKINDLYYMFYFDTSHKDEVVDRYAWTTAAEFPRGWRYGGPVIKNDKDYNKTFAHKPFVLIKDNILYHYYTAVGDQGRCIALQTFDLKSKKEEEINNG